jgi:hypothetical protein
VWIGGIAGEDKGYYQTTIEVEALTEEGAKKVARKEFAKLAVVGHPTPADRSPMLTIEDVLGENWEQW